jgi:hypothetical protein
MLEPFEKSDQEDTRVKMDREALYSMMKSWLVPRTTGILILPGQENRPDKTKPSSNNPFEGSSLNRS